MPLPMIRLALIGAGRWGRNYIRTIMGLDGAELVVVASGNPETAGLVPRGVPNCVGLERNRPARRH